MISLLVFLLAIQARFAVCLVSHLHHVHKFQPTTKLFSLNSLPSTNEKIRPNPSSRQENSSYNPGTEKEAPFMLLQWKGTVLSTIYPTMLGFMAFSAVVVATKDTIGIYLPAGDKLTSIMTLTIGLLLAFRTSTAYERWGEGRKAWGRISMHTRTMVRELVFGIVRQDGTMPEEKILCYRDISKLILAFPLATQHSLRRLPYEDDKDLISLLPQHLHKPYNSGVSKFIAHEVLLALQSYIMYCEKKGMLDRDQMMQMLVASNGMGEALSVMERIIDNAAPISYTVHLNQIVFLYFFFLPFQLAVYLKFWTVILVGLAVFTFYGLQIMGDEIENPFGNDKNDLPLEKYCAEICEDIWHSLGPLADPAIGRIGLSESTGGVGVSLGPLADPAIGRIGLSESTGGVGVSIQSREGAEEAFPSSSSSFAEWASSRSKFPPAVPPGLVSSSLAGGAADAWRAAGRLHSFSPRDWSWASLKGPDNGSSPSAVSATDSSSVDDSDSMQASSTSVASASLLSDDADSQLMQL